MTIFSRRRKGSLVRRFNILLMMWGLLIYAFSVCGFWWGSVLLIEKTYHTQAKQWLLEIDDLSSPLYLSKHSGEYDTVKRFLKSVQEIAYVRFLEADGVTLIASYENYPDEERPFPQFNLPWLVEKNMYNISLGRPLSSKLASDSALMRIVSPVTISAMTADDILDFDMDSDSEEQVSVIGYIDMGMDFSIYHQQVASNILYGSLIFSAVFVIAALLGRVLISNALKPLSDLRDPLDHLAT